jgi:uncharacterized protein YjlB
MTAACRTILGCRLSSTAGYFKPAGGPPRPAWHCSSTTVWGGVWRNGIYAHHHYHSTAHEVLGIAAGSVRVRPGGADGKTVELSAGDVVVVPAGVVHKSERGSPDLVVVGAYPRGQSPDMGTPGAPGHENAAARVAAVPLPSCDPVYGVLGRLLERWRAA